jgi:hypothetical protein
MLPVCWVQSNTFGFDKNIVISKLGNGGLLDLSLTGFLDNDCVILGHIEIDGAG